MTNKVKIKLKDIITCKKKIHWSKKQLNMVDGISDNYDEDISLIWVTKFNEIIDGHHRYEILINKFGGEHEITVRQFNVSKKIFKTIVYIFLPLSLIILLPLYLIIERFKFKKWQRKKENIELMTKS